MTAGPSIDLPGWMAEQLSQASPDLLRHMVQTFAEALMSADADAVCGAGYGQRSPDRRNVRNGYRQRGWDTRAGSIDLAIPKLREGSYFPDWLLERRRRAESALASVVATSYLLGVSTRRMEKLGVEQLGITRLSKSQVSEMARDLDGQVEAFRSRPLDASPYTFLAADALVLKVREGGRTVNVHALGSPLLRCSHLPDGTLLVSCNDTRYTVEVIVSFSHKGLERLYRGGSKKGVQAAHVPKLLRILSLLDVAQSPDDLAIPSFRTHPLRGDLAGYWSIWVNGNWRITFRFNETDVELVDYQDYH